MIPKNYIDVESRIRVISQKLAKTNRLNIAVTALLLKSRAGCTETKGEANTVTAREIGKIDTSQREKAVETSL